MSPIEILKEIGAEESLIREYEDYVENLKRKKCFECVNYLRHERKLTTEPNVCKDCTVNNGSYNLFKAV